MPVVDGKEVLAFTAEQLDELLFNVNFGSVDYAALQQEISPLFINETIDSSSTKRNETGLYTGNNAKMSVTFAQTGSSTNCTMNLYGSDYEDLSLPGIISTLTIGAGWDPVRFAIDPIAIPAYTFCEIINNDSINPAIVTVNISTWK